MGEQEGPGEQILTLRAAISHRGVVLPPPAEDVANEVPGARGVQSKTQKPTMKVCLHQLPEVAKLKKMFPNCALLDEDGPRM